jgi:hypothetical protein
MVSIAYEQFFILQNMPEIPEAKLKQFSEDDITCGLTLKAFGLLTLDAICCLPCCCFFGGCFGKYLPFIYKLDPISAEQTKPGLETCAAVCNIQTGAALLLPITCCGCCYCCCGLGKPCAKMAFRKMQNNENHVSINPVLKAPEVQTTVLR